MHSKPGNGGAMAFIRARDRERDKMGSKSEAAAPSSNGRRNGGILSSGGVACCSWHCIWAFFMAASVVLYTFALLGPAPQCSSAQREGIQIQQQEQRRMQHFPKTFHPGMVHRSAADASPPGAGAAAAAAAEWSGDLRLMESAWNRLCFGAAAHERLRIALFVKKWPVGGVPGGLERHALTLHRVLAARGHQVHVYTNAADDQAASSSSEESSSSSGNLQVHFFRPTQSGGFDYNAAWEDFSRENSSLEFDIVHSESVALPHWKAAGIESLAASWHGIGYEIIHSELVQDMLLRRRPASAAAGGSGAAGDRPAELQRSLAERLPRVADEIRFFPSYYAHVATSDYVADVLRTVYGIPRGRVHTVLNGVDVDRFRPDVPRGEAFRAKFGIPRNATLVLGAAGRLVRDKGHPLLFEAFARVAARHQGVYLLVAGSGPWGDRYRELAPAVKTLGPLAPDSLGSFYNAIDAFVNPTLRAQGLDHTLLEAMQCGKPLLATRFSSITWSVVVSEELGYTFAPDVDSLEEALERAVADGATALRAKGQACREYASLMFTAEKMGTSYERLFLCMKNSSYCMYPLPGDCPVQHSRY